MMTRTSTTTTASDWSTYRSGDDAFRAPRRSLVPPSCSRRPPSCRRSPAGSFGDMEQQLAHVQRTPEVGFVPTGVQDPYRGARLGSGLSGGLWPCAPRVVCCRPRPARGGRSILFHNPALKARAIHTVSLEQDLVVQMRACREAAGPH